MKLLKATDDSSKGGYAGSDVQQRAYLVLNNITELEEALSTRIEALLKAKNFFQKANEVSLTVENIFNGVTVSLKGCAIRFRV